MLPIALIPIALRGPLLLTFASPPAAESGVEPELQRPRRSAAPLEESKPTEVPIAQEVPVPWDPFGPDAPPPQPPANPVAPVTSPLVPAVPVEPPPVEPPPAADEVSPVETTPDKLRFFRLGSTIGGSLPGSFGYYGGGTGVAFTLEAGGFYRRSPRFGSGFLLAIGSGSFLIPDLVVAHRLHATRRILAAKKLRIDSLVTMDLGIRLPGWLIPGGLLGVGWGVRFVVKERLELIVRPFNIEMTAPAFTSLFYVDLRVGGGLSVGYVF